MKTAMQHPHLSRMAILPDGREVMKDKALREGYRLVAFDENRIVYADQVAQASVAAGVSPELAWRRAIMALPEARGRDSAVAELLTSQSHATMSVENARAFLRGLPTELSEQPVASPADRPVDPRAARLAEISGSMRVYNQRQGYTQESKAYARVDTSGATLKRATELRLAALTTRAANGDEGARREHKSLAYALRAHEQTGSPLETIFTHLGVDASKMLRT